MKKIFKLIISTLLVLIISTILVASVRGNIGNPNSKDLSITSWKESGPFELSPERGRFGLLYSLIEDKSFYFSVDLARFIAPDLGYSNGHYVSLFAPAVSFIAIPGYLIGKYFGASQFGAFAVVSIFGLINLIFIQKIVTKLTSNSIAGWLAGIIFLFSTPAYAYSVNLYQHHISTFLILTSILILVSYRHIAMLSIVWFLCAMSIPVDYPNLFLMFPIGLYAITKVISLNKIKTIVNLNINLVGIVTLLSMILPILFFLWFNKNSYNDPLQFSGTVASVRAIDANGKPTSAVPVSVEDAEWYANPDNQDKSSVGFFKTRYILNGLYIHILSPDRGVVYFAPVLILGIFGASILQKRKNEYIGMLLGIIAANISLYSMWGDPWGGWAFGSRYLIPAYAIMSIFIGVALSEIKRRWLFAIALYPLLVYSVLVNTLGALTTSANPPKVEALPLEAVSGKQERYSYDRNWEVLKSGKSKSFIFQTIAEKYIDSVTYYYIISGTIITLTTSLIIFLVFRKEKS